MAQQTRRKPPGSRRDAPGGPPADGVGLDLSTDAGTARFVAIDGVRYPLADGRSMRMVNAVPARALALRIGEIIAAGTLSSANVEAASEAASELETALRRVVGYILPSAPAAVLDKLPDGERMRLLDFFTRGVSRASTSLTKAGMAKRSRHGSNGSTAAPIQAAG